MTMLQTPVRRVRVAPQPVAPDERLARRAMRAQIARLEGRLSALIVTSFPEGGIDAAVPVSHGPRVQSLADLERQRDALAQRVADATALLERRSAQHERARVRLEHMLLEPGAYRFERITQRELGEHGCGVWRVVPRLGLIGMLAGWWHVKISSGCPLAT